MSFSRVGSHPGFGPGLPGCRCARHAADIRHNNVAWRMSFHQGSKHHVAKVHWTVVALQDDWPRLALFPIAGYRCEPVDHTLGDELAVGDDAHVHAYQADVIHLPLARILADVLGGTDAAVEPA